MSDRRGEISAALHEVRQRIAAACAAAGRSPDEITLIAVTKTRPVSDIALLCELGVPDIGENRDQEARAKADQAAALGLRPVWHFVGAVCKTVDSGSGRIASLAAHIFDRWRR